MHVNDDMHWRFHRCLHKCIEDVVHVKVDDILDEHKHICKEHVQRLLQNTYTLPKKNYSFLQHVATRKLQSHIKRRYLLPYAIEQTTIIIFYVTINSLATPKLALHAFMVPHFYKCVMQFILCLELGTISIPDAECLLTCHLIFCSSVFMAFATCYIRKRFTYQHDAF